MSFIVYIVFRILVLIFSIIPFKGIYILSNFFVFILYRLAGYRKKVVVANLKRAFPDKSESEIINITSQFYKNLCDILVETFKGFTLSEKQIKSRFKLVNADILEKFANENKSVLALTGHTGNWEWGILSAPYFLSHLPIGFYKPLSNKHLDAYVRRNRTRTNSLLCSIYVTALSFEHYLDKKAIYLMVADQSPSNKNKAIRVNFFGINTLCLHGAENYSRKYNLPVFYFNVHRIKRGYYEVELVLLTDKPNDLPYGEITVRYMNELEKYIKNNPPNWLWSHRRWKHSPATE